MISRASKTPARPGPGDVPTICDPSAFESGVSSDTFVISDNNTVSVLTELLCVKVISRARHGAEQSSTRVNRVRINISLI